MLADGWRSDKDARYHRGSGAFDWQCAGPAVRDADTAQRRYPSTRDEHTHGTDRGTTLRNQFRLWKCVTASTVICYGVYTRKQPGAAGDYAWTLDYWSKFKLFDNFKIEHAAQRWYYVNGRGLAQPTVTLGPDESIWYAVEFADGSDDITKASVILPDERGYGKLQLTAPVGKELPPLKSSRA
jgi:hypothetical protein